MICTWALVSGSYGLGNYVQIWVGKDKSLNDSETVTHLNKSKLFDNEMSVLRSSREIEPL